jgi:Spy/CpxP family protein refolding chaperone
MMKKKLVVGLLVGLLITGTALAAHYDFPACQPRLELMGILTHMKITDGQKHAVALILMRHKPDFQPVMASLKAARTDMRRAMRADPPDAKGVLDAYRRLTSAGEKFVMLVTDVLAEIRGVLTSEQRRILKEGQARLDTAIACRMQSRRALLQKWIEVHAQ